MNTFPVTSWRALIVAGALLAGCSVNSEDPVALKLTELENRLIQLERVLQNQTLLDLSNQLTQVQAEMRGLRGEMETVQFEAESQRKRQRELYLDLDKRLNSLTGSSFGGSRIDAGLPEGDQAAYRAALGHLNGGNYQRAAQSFQQFLATYPESGLAGNAQYWLGEAHYVNREFSRALTEFRKVDTDYKDSRKRADALLKIAYVEQELGNDSAARTALQRTIAEYPDTTAAGLAKQRLDQLN